MILPSVEPVFDTRDVLINQESMTMRCFPTKTCRTSALHSAFEGAGAVSSMVVGDGSPAVDQRHAECTAL